MRVDFSFCELPFQSQIRTLAHSNAHTVMYVSCISLYVYFIYSVLRFGIVNFIFRTPAKLPEMGNQVLR